MPSRNDPCGYRRNSRSSFTATVTKRLRRRRHVDGTLILHPRFVVNFRDLHGKRRQVFFRSRQEAVAFRDDLVARAKKGNLSFGSPDLTLKAVLDHWLAETKLHVKPTTWSNYQRVHTYILGPLRAGSSEDRRSYTLGRKELGDQQLPLLGNIHIFDLSTARIRLWHNTLVENVGRRTAQEMKRCLGAALRLAAEDFEVTVPTMPAHTPRGADRHGKAVLNPTQVRQLLAMAMRDPERGVFYAFPFLTGLRPSEQLGLLWDSVDFDAGTIVVRRTQEPNGAITEATKTSASVRQVPIPPMLEGLLRAWRHHCPIDSQGLGRVFVTLGRTYRTGRASRRGLPLTYYNFRTNYWAPALAASNLPYVTPHSARHTYISTLQAAGVEVGLVAKLVGHANANVTLAHYTHAMRGGEAAVQRLQEMYVSI